MSRNGCRVQGGLLLIPALHIVAVRTVFRPSNLAAREQIFGLNITIFIRSNGLLTALELSRILHETDDASSLQH